MFDLLQAVELVNYDFESGAGASFEVVDSTDHDGHGASVVRLRAWSGMTLGLAVDPGISSADGLQLVADQVQDFLVEELAATGRSSIWPACRHHAGSHPAVARVVNGEALWVCPANSRPVAAIGELGAASGRGP